MCDGRVREVKQKTQRQPIDEQQQATAPAIRWATAPAILRLVGQRKAILLASGLGGEGPSMGAGAIVGPSVGNWHHGGEMATPLTLPRQRRWRKTPWPFPSTLQALTNVSYWWKPGRSQIIQEPGECSVEVSPSRSEKNGAEGRAGPGWARVYIWSLFPSHFNERAALPSIPFRNEGFMPSTVGSIAEDGLQHLWIVCNPKSLLAWDDFPWCSGVKAWPLTTVWDHGEGASKLCSLFSHSLVSDSLQPHGLQHARLPISRNLLKLMFIKSVMPSNHLILCRPLLLLPSVSPSIKVFSSESVLHIR